MEERKHNLIQDLAIVALSIFIAVILVQTKVIANLLNSAQSLKLLGNFLAGVFFTSIFTVAPATVTLIEIAKTASLFLTAFIGALGAAVGDLIIFLFVRDRISEDMGIKMLFKPKLFRWLAFLIGGLIIASPLPDELGIGLMGFSKMKTSYFIPISFSFNFIGIFLIGLAAKSLF